MIEIIRLVKADFMKMRHTAFYYIHTIMPILGAMLVLIYFAIAKRNIMNVDGYLQVVAMVFPFLISIVCSEVIEQEEIAGNFKELFTYGYGKNKAFISKLIVLLISGTYSTILAVGGFALGLEFILKQNQLTFNEARGGAEKRFDIVITYNKKMYIIELKIWSVEQYHKKGLGRVNIKTESLLRDRLIFSSILTQADETHRAGAASYQLFSSYIA